MKFLTVKNLVVGVAVCWALYAIVAICVPRSDMGQFGDAFGALNTLFSGLAFAVIFASLFEQRTEFNKQYELQKQQIDQQRDEMGRIEARHRESLKVQSLTNSAVMAKEMYLDKKKDIANLEEQKNSFRNREWSPYLEALLAQFHDTEKALEKSLQTLEAKMYAALEELETYEKKR